MSLATLQNIRTLVRQVTRSPSPNQVSDSDLDDFINTFILYRFPAQLRLFSLRTTLTFYTQPFVDVYDTNTTDPTNALYNFKNLYLAVHPPVFLAGIQGFYTQWRDIFYGYWPQTNTIADTLVPGDGTSGPFTGNITAHPFLQNNVIITCLDTTGAAMVLVDYPVSNSLGALGQPNVPQTLPSPFGQVNYVTGDFTVNFPGNTQVMAPILSEVIAYQPGKPLSVLYYDNKFTIRPVPDKVYAIQIEADIRPTALIADSDETQLEAWWEYIGYGASIILFERRNDRDSINLVMPSFKERLSEVLRTSLTQQANERTVTIYTQGKNYGFGWFGPGGWPY